MGGKDSLSRNGKMDRERRCAILRIKKREMAMVVALKEGAAIVKRVFCKNPPAPASKFGTKPGSMSELVVLKVYRRRFLKLPNKRVPSSIY